MQEIYIVIIPRKDEKGGSSFKSPKDKNNVCKKLINCHQVRAQPFSLK